MNVLKYGVDLQLLRRDTAVGTRTVRDLHSCDEHEDRETTTTHGP